jgi:hypothetical protein
MFDQANCTGGEKKWTPGDLCRSIGSEYGRSVPGTVIGTATCASKGGEALGELTPTTPTTVCCTR